MKQESSPQSVREMQPEQKTLPLEGLYLNQNLKQLATGIGRSLVIANYVTDKNDIIATRDPEGNFQVARELKNPYDWRLFQELEAQADIIITGGAYLKRFAQKGDAAENVLTQFEPGGQFASLGEWRLQHGYNFRSPDISIVGRNLDFSLPSALLTGSHHVFVFTTDSQVESPTARKLVSSGATVIGSGDNGVDGGKMITKLEELGYRVIKMTTGPRVLKLLLDASVLDRLYITQVQIDIPHPDPSLVQTVLSGDQKITGLHDFIHTHTYVQDYLITDAGITASQKFLIFDHRRFLSSVQPNNEDARRNK